MVEFILNGQTMSVTEGTTILQAAMQIGVEIPYFCYHPRLSIAGNCRMCLVEVETIGKPQASCMTQVRQGMVVNTHSPMTRKAQEGAMEFLLLNHPLDCPICDQGGECDLQNIAFRYGRGESRSCSSKRGVPPKDMGALIGTAMTRCIHCTRCIRFAKEVAGIAELSIQGRGEHAEIMTYVDAAIQSELSGNLADVCPVGALTNKPYGMQWRPWELTHTSTIDVMDGMGSHVYMDIRDNKLFRVRPRACEDINQEWLADHSRYTIDGLSQQRLEQPSMRHEDGLLKPTNWHEAVNTVAELFNTTDSHETAVLLGDLVDLETAILVKHLCEQRGIIHRDSRVHPIPSKHRCHYTIPPLNEIDEADVILIINAPLRRTAPLLNIRLRKKKVAYTGPEMDLTYPTTWLGNDLSNLKKSPFYATLQNAKKPLILVDPSVYNNALLCQNINTLMEEIPAFVQESWIGFGCVGHSAGQVGALDAGVTPGQGGYDTDTILSQNKRWKLLLLVGFDNPRLEKQDAHIVYMGHHYDAGAEKAHIVLPTRTYTEKNASYVNIMGLRQSTKKAIQAPAHTRNDWHVIQALHQRLGGEMMLDSIDDIPYPTTIETSKWQPIPLVQKPWQSTAQLLDNVIARHSPTWQKARAKP